MSLGGGCRKRVRCSILTFVVLLGCHAPQCSATALFGDAPPTKGNNRDLPAIATAFVQTGNELHYFSDVQYHEDLIGGAPVKSTDDGEPMLNNQLQFSPKELSFGEQALGVPSQQKVSIKNPTASTVRFDAISGSTIHFHCSFPEHKIVNPEEETSFDVVFLPRQEGTIENVLFVHSSLGTFTYSVRGVGSGNPYRIRPLVGARVPINGTFVSAVQLYNPHSTTLHVKEMYTSGGDVHLELPDTAPDKVHDGSLWEIAPYQTKTIMNAKLLAARERNATAYIKIKTDLKRRKAVLEDGKGTVKTIEERFEETLIVPVEVEITRKRGLFSTSDVLDFGLVRIGERSGQLMLEVVSTLEKGLEIESLYVAEKGTDDPSGIYMEFASKPPIAVKCGARQQPGAPKPIAKVTFDSKLIKIPPGTKYMRYRGKITAESRSGNYNISVPYVATLYSGTLLPDVEDTTFLAYINPPASHAVTLKNTLPFGVTIWNVTVDESGKDVFLAKLLTRVVVLLPGESRPAFWLRYLKKKPDGFTAHVTLHTNVTTFYVPVSVHDGKIKVTLYSIDQAQFDFGLMNISEKKTILFTISNKNPMPVTIRHLRRGLPSLTTLALKGVETGNKTVLSEDDKKNWSQVWRPGMEFTLPGRGFAVFNYTLTSPLDHVLLRDTFTIETDFQSLTYPVKYGIEEGTVASIPDSLVFPESFPFKIGYQSLQLYSTFKRDMRVLRLSTLSRDPRMHFELLSGEKMPVLKSNQVSYLGRVQFRPNATCGESNCYLGINLNSGEGQWFTYGMKLPANLAEIDTYLYKRLRKRWTAMQAQGKHIVNETIIVDTDEVQHIPIPVTGELVWPRLLTRSVVHFPLTAVGNFTIMNLTLQNPASTSVIVQLIPLVIYPDADNLVEFFRDSLDSPLTDPIEMNETLMFSLRDTELFTLNPDSPVPLLREELQEIVGMQIPKFTLSMLLRPGMKVRIRLGFFPSDYTLRSSLLLIRNNLTVIEPVVLYGKGSPIDLQVDGRPARSGNALTFEILKHHLTDCYNPKRLVHKLNTTLTVKRSFTVMNTGEVTFTVVNMSINGMPCENRGFRILNCYPFRLAPNETHILDVAHTPDFLITWNEAALQFYMHKNNSAWVFPLGASIPFSMLSKCHAALPRPNWEWFIYYGFVALLILFFICVWAASYVEGEKTVEEAIRQQYSQSLRVFDLNAVEMNGKSKDVTTSSTAEPSKSLSQRYEISYSDDSSVLYRIFWEVAQGVLWLFSQLLWFHRVKANTAACSKANKNRRSKAPVVKPVHDNSVSNSKETKDVGVGNSVISSPAVKRNVNKNGKISADLDNAIIANNITVQPAAQKVVKNEVRPSTKPKQLANHSPPMRSTATHQVLTRTKTAEAAVPTSQSRKNSRSVDMNISGKQRVSESSSDVSRTSPAPNSAGEEKEKKKGKVLSSDRNEKNRTKRGNVKPVTPKAENGAAYAVKQQPKTATAKIAAPETMKTRVDRNPSGKVLHHQKESLKSDPESSSTFSSRATMGVHRSEQGLHYDHTFLLRNDHLNEWMMMNSDRSADVRCDERSEAGFSDSGSAAPEWDTFTNLEEGNVDEDYDAIFNDTSCFENQVKSTDTVPPSLPGRSNQPPPKRNGRKKQMYSSNKTSNASSRSTSLSSAEDLGPGRLDPFSQRRNHRYFQEGNDAGVIGSRYPVRKPETLRPSSFMQELQKERRQEEEEHRKRKALFAEENWPGLNLKFPVLEELYISGQAESAQSSKWPPCNAELNDTPQVSDVKESVLKFRLNPKAQPFVYSSAQQQNTPDSDVTFDSSPSVASSPPLTSSSLAFSPRPAPSPPLESSPPLASSPSLGPEVPACDLCEGLMNDPLGYSGSLFRDSLNIWATSNTHPDEPVLWAEKFLAEQDEKLDLPTDD